MSHLLDHLKEKYHAHHADSSTTSSPHLFQHNFMTSDQDTAINIHNTARGPKGCPNVIWSDALAADAAAYAQKIADEDRMHHSGVAGQGENLYWSSDEGTYEDAVNMWLRESEKYHGEKIGEGNLADWGHYTQAMWKSSTNVGMGKATSKSGGTYIVARYTPQGNMYGERPF